MLSHILEFIYLTFAYSIGDILMEYANINGRYYFMHAINNFFITYHALPAVIYSYTNFDNIQDYEWNYKSTVYCFALHMYHVCMYYKSLTFDDKMHHVLMCGIAMPLGMYLPKTPLMDHSIFYLSGGASGINYFILFLTRNGYVERIKQKRINNFINQWIRCPGCISQVALSVATYYKLYDQFTQIQSIFYYSIIFLIYLNGIYYMKQVSDDYNKNKFRISNSITSSS